MGIDGDMVEVNQYHCQFEVEKYLNTVTAKTIKSRSNLSL